MTLKTKPWNASEHIINPEEYLKASLEAVQETGDSRIFNQALNDVAKMQTISEIRIRQNKYIQSFSSRQSTAF